jgi:hypothetical protein
MPASGRPSRPPGKGGYAMAKKAAKKAAVKKTAAKKATKKAAKKR